MAGLPEAVASMTPAEARAACEAGLHSMATARWLTVRCVEGLSEAQWMHQVAAGANHPMFNVGHVAVCDANFLKAAGGASVAVPDSWTELFDGGRDPVADSGAYPEPAELLGVLERVRVELVDHLHGLGGEQLLAAPEEPRLAGVVPTLAHLPGFIAMHEGTHTGQVLLARRALGLAGVLGG